MNELPTDLKPLVLQGNVLDLLASLPRKSVHCAIFSPPFWGLRRYDVCGCAQDYKREEGVEHPLPRKANTVVHRKEPDPNCRWCHGTGFIPGMETVWGGVPAHDHQWTEVLTRSGNGSVEATMKGETLNPNSATRAPRVSKVCSCGAWFGALGLEPTPQLYVAHMVEVFRALRPVLRDDATVWCEIGDTYLTHPAGVTDPAKRVRASTLTAGRDLSGSIQAGLMDKRQAGIPEGNMALVPHRVVIALQENGWVLRQTYVWGRPNPMPESVRNRGTTSHSYIFQFCKARWIGPPEEWTAKIVAEDARWLALLIDTEGCIVIKHASETGVTGAQVTITNTSLPLLQRAREIAGEGWFLTKEGKNAPIHTLQWSNKPALRILRAAYPYLIVKRLQARLAIYLEERTSTNRAGDPETYEKRGRTFARTERWNDLRTEIWRSVKALNKFGALSPELLSAIPEPDYGHWGGAGRYYWDRENAREAQTGNAHPRGSGSVRKGLAAPGSGIRLNTSYNAAMIGQPPPEAGRNMLSVWTIPTQAFKDKHYATFPEEIPRRCIAISTSDRGCCPECGAPFERVTGLGEPDRAWQRSAGGDVDGEYAGVSEKTIEGTGAQDPSEVKRRVLAGMTPNITVGWKPRCDHFPDPCDRCGESWVRRKVKRRVSTFSVRVRDAKRGALEFKSGMGGDVATATDEEIEDYPGGRAGERESKVVEVEVSWPACRCRPLVAPIVLDPFAGSGTTLLKARQMYRRSIGIELSSYYVDMMQRRLAEETGGLATRFLSQRRLTEIPEEA